MVHVAVNLAVGHVVLHNNYFTLGALKFSSVKGF